MVAPPPPPKGPKHVVPAPAPQVAQPATRARTAARPGHEAHAPHPAQRGHAAQAGYPGHDSVSASPQPGSGMQPRERAHSVPLEDANAPDAPDPNSPPVQWLHRVLGSAAKRHASDIHVHAGARVKARRFGELVDLTKDVLTAQEAQTILDGSLYGWQRDALLQHGEVDFAYAVPNVGRFRANLYRCHTGLCGAYHYIPAKAPELDELGLPDTIRKLVNHQNGIVLVTGPSGCGKTSTLASLVNIINHEREDHILSIEDPIEYVHVTKRCIVNQRQINRHTMSFSAALKSALREDPDIICIGELRDLETISLALSAAETGHLVLGTLHTQGAVRTINRLIGAYPSRQQPQIRTMLSESLRAVLSQKLLPRADGEGVVVAYELLVMNHASANLIRENRTFQLGSVLQTGRNQGMRAFDDSLRELVQKQLITKRVAALNSDNPKLFA